MNMEANIKKGYNAGIPRRYFCLLVFAISGRSRLCSWLSGLVENFPTVHDLDLYQTDQMCHGHLSKNK